MIELLLALVLSFAPLVTVLDQTPPALMVIHYGETVMGELSTLRPEALYTFTGQTGDVVVITMERTSGSIDPLLLLTDSAQNNVLALDNDGGGAPNARLQFILPESANFVIKASAVQTSDLAGTFRLMLSAPNATPIPARTPILSNLQPSQVGTVIVEQPLRVYPFILQTNDMLTLKWAFNGDADLIVYSTDFAELARNARDTAELALTAPYDGLYWLVVRWKAGAGTFKLDATFPPHSLITPETLRLIPGQVQRGSFEQAIGARYAFGTPANTFVSLTLKGQGVVILYDLSDGAFRELASGSTLRDVKLTAAGTYYLLVIGTTGEFSFMLQGTLEASVSLTPQGTPFSNQLAYGDSVRGQISEGTPRLFYTFRGNAEEVITIQLVHAANSPLDPLLYLYQYVDGKPQLLATVNDTTPGNVDATLTDFKLPANSTFLIVASGANNTAGAFILSLSRRAK
jgi:hypothetical protein